MRGMVFASYLHGVKMPGRTLSFGRFLRTLLFIIPANTALPDVADRDDRKGQNIKRKTVRTGKDETPYS